MTEEQNVLADELATYSANKAELLAKHPEQYVLIKGSDIVATFESELDAVRQGIRQFGNVPFLVRQIAAIEVMASYTSALLAV